MKKDFAASRFTRMTIAASVRPVRNEDRMTSAKWAEIRTLPSRMSPRIFGDRYRGESGQFVRNSIRVIDPVPSSAFTAAFEGCAKGHQPQQPSEGSTGK